MPGLGLGFAPSTGRVAAKSTVLPPPAVSSSSTKSASPFAVCYVSSQGNAHSSPSSRFNNSRNINNNTDVSYNNTSVTALSSNNNNEKQKVDPSDPRVKKLVYSMYRDMLTSRNGEANDIISKKDPTIVIQDTGVGPILESIITRQRGSVGSGGDSPGGAGISASDCTEEGGSTNGSTMAPPPPPPPMMPGAIPAVRLRSEIGPRDKGPPAALAGAMMKDKKPFTYTPGGIDLSEIRSPRMAKRIQMNAAAEGVTNTPSPSASLGNQERAPCQLPPAALAAMQPQMAIPVFPQGSINAVQLNRSHKPVDYSGQPPPPPPPQPMSAPIIRQPPPPPPPAPLSPQPNRILSQPVSAPIPKSPPPPRTPPPPPERAATPRSPVPAIDSYAGNSPTNNLNERRSPLGRKSPACETAQGVGTGSLFIPQIEMQSPPAAAPKSPSPMSNYVPPSARPAGQTKAQAVSQNIGSLYIPPIGAQPQQQVNSGAGSSSNGNIAATRIPQSVAQQQSATPPSASAIPATPQLNKAPIPWMNSYNRIQSQQADSPPYVHPGFFMPPWGPPMGARTIPIMMPGGTDQMDTGGSPMTSPFQGQGTESRRSSSGSSTPSGSRTPSQAATHLGRVIPIQIEREEAAKAKGAKIIPIQIEGRPPRVQTPSTPTTPGMNPMRRVSGPQFNSPMGLYSTQNAMDAFQRQAAEAAAGIDKINVRCESPRTEPMQSKSLRMIQQAAENELKRLEQEQGQQYVDLSADDHHHLLNLFKPQVHEGSSMHQSAEPRFKGGHIPSRAFRALQTALPASPGAQDLPPPSYPAAAFTSGGPVTHHIPIRQVVSPTPPQSQPSEIQLSSQQQQGNVPPSEQKVQEPKKYMGSNIPSRSFKILQQMTADDGDQPVDYAADGETTLEQNTEESYNDDVDDTYSPSSGESFVIPPQMQNLYYSPSVSSYPLSLSCSSEGGGSSTFDPYANNCNGNNNNSCNGNNNNVDNCNNNDGSSSSWPDSQQQGWDPYSYMWYYWWYYTSCYWAGYDMTGYEYPPGWDPNYPYCPPEFFSDYSSEYCSAGSGTDLGKSFGDDGGLKDYSENQENDDNDNCRMHFPSVNGAAVGVPRIVIEDEERKKSYVGVDSIKDNDSSRSSSNNSKVASPSSLLTECNEKPGSLPYTMPYNSKKNDCDKDMNVSGGEKMNAWTENHNRKNGKDNDDNVAGAEEVENELSSSDEEYESCCEDPEQKVIERETGPYNNKNNNTRAFLTSSQNFATARLDESKERKFELNNGNNYNSELNANDHGGSGGVEKGNKREKNDDENEDEDEKTDPGTDEDNDDDYGGRAAIIDEPETASSADDSDAITLANGEELQRCGKSTYYENNGLSIEEYHSEESSESAIFDYGLGKNRLSTIDEITESRASSSLLSSYHSFDSNSTVTAKNLSAETDPLSKKKNSGNVKLMDEKRNENSGGGGESEDSESSDELSSVSVIENKSDATRGTESKREDETTSTSEEDSSTDDDADDNENDNDDDKAGKGGQDQYDDEEEGTDTAVTVRLPLKLCFTKTKSYRDIATLMVGDSEIEETSQVSMPSSSSNEDEAKLEKCEESGNEKDNEEDEEEDDDEPVVSFTISLSRQTSTEDENKLKETINTDCNESDDIDFWAEITKEDEQNDVFTRESFGYEKESESWKHEKGNENKGGNVEKQNFEGKERSNNSETNVGFWGVIRRDRSQSDRVRMRNKGQQENGGENTSSSVYGWDPCESIDYKWEKDFNFWEKSSRTIETRRFSGNFEISEDYESDTGIKPSTERKERVKKYTHHKRHSIPGPIWDSRSSLPPRPTPKQYTLISTGKSSYSGFNNNEQEIKPEERKFDDASTRQYGKVEAGVVMRMPKQEKRSESLSLRQTVDSYQDDTDTSSWWSYWDEVSKQNDSEEEKLEINEDDAFAGTTATTSSATATTEREVEKIVPAEVTSTADDDSISVAIKLSEAGGSIRTSYGESTGGEEDYQSCASSIVVLQQTSWMDSEGNDDRGSFFSLENKNKVCNKEEKSLNTFCQSDATDNEDYLSSSPEIKSSSLLFPTSSCNQEEAVTTTTTAEKLIQQGPVSDENSDESSRSSGTTIGLHDKTSEIKPSHQQILLATTSSSDIKADCESSPLKGRDDKEANTTKALLSSSLNNEDNSSIQIPVTIERNVEIQHEIGCSGYSSGGSERAKLYGRQQEDNHHHNHTLHHHQHTSAINNTSSAPSETCTCFMGDRIARAENLLWRIERFLHESLSLGSEDDSGVMTDLSRQISDVDTDVDNDMNDTEFLLTAANVAKERRGVAFTTPPVTTPEPAHHHHPQQDHIASCNFAETISSTDPPQAQSSSNHHQQQQQTNSSSLSQTTNTSNNFSSTTSENQTHHQQQHQVKRPRPKSDIFLESTLLSKVETEATTAQTITSTNTEENNSSGGGVKMRSASERRALRYQRAKTHSRLFQLLQDECGRDEEQDSEFDYESDVGTLTSSCNHNNNNNKSTTVASSANNVCQISIDCNSATTEGVRQEYHHHQVVMDDDDGTNSNNNNESCTGTNPTKMNDAQARRSRLLPLPIKNLLASSLSLDSNSSPSGSSGVLSPTSPVNRDQLLADIINEFHLRNQASSVRAQSQRRISNSFPSKIFKLLQHEFGEEFYQTFDCCGGSSSGGGIEDCLISPSMSTNLCVNDSTSSNLAGGGSSSSIVHECTIHKSESMKEIEEATNRILTNFMLRNTTSSSNNSTVKSKTSTAESLCNTTATQINSPLTLQDDSRNFSAEFLEVPMRRKKGNLGRDLRSPKCTKQS